MLSVLTMNEFGAGPDLRRHGLDSHGAEDGPFIRFVQGPSSGEIRKDDRFKNVPLVMLSGVASTASSSW
jgi:hypothetical protein